MSRVQANLLLVFIALIWGSAFVAQAQGMADVGPMLFTGVRFLIGALVVAPLAWMDWRKLKREDKQPSPRDWRRIVGLGLLMLLGAALQQIGIVSTTVTNAGFLTALYVPLVPVLSWLWLRHLPHWSVWPGALACLVGAFLLSGAHELNIGAGDLWVIASAIPWAVHVLLVGRVADKLAAPFLVAFGQFVVCGLLALAWALMMEPVSLAGLKVAAGPIAYTGVLSVGIAFTAQVVAQRYAHAADAAIILSSETLFAAVFGYLLMGDRLSSAGLLGCGLILVSMLAIQLLPLLRLTRLKSA
ncbi:DMT family transporter [Pelomonas sp. SE-A7]|uniref:DMT family transporter n=1 Tax=Pelomonas sp. SE-A7 TaxID=3054953 RepID=UPI00259CACBB|nr:DMT family transporter [Pelomonas sp. SE-A7]MDM4765376.1 DMT family transporter [Pelomonas sp. SE-A7]